MNHYDFVIEHRKNHPISLVIGLSLFAAIFINKQPVLATSKEACIIFATLFLTFNGFLLLLIFCIDSVSINSMDKTLCVERKIGPFKKSYLLDSSNYRFLSIYCNSRGRGHHYEIGLKRDEQSEPIRLIDTYFLGDTWNKAIKIAQCLDLPIYDTVWWDTVIWKKDMLPKDKRQRKEILKNKAGNEQFFMR